MANPFPNPMLAEILGVYKSVLELPSEEKAAALTIYHRLVAPILTHMPAAQLDAFLENELRIKLSVGQG